MEAAAPARDRLGVGELGERYVRHLEALGRKRSTVQDYRIMLRRHFEPFFGDRAVDPNDVAHYIQAKDELARQTVLNHVNFLHGVFAYAIKRGWASTNPTTTVDRPRADGGDPDLRFLDQVELEALLRSTPDDTDRVLYLTAAMTGLHQGELIALRWRDVDWAAGRLRVRRSFVRGEYTTPKSKRGSRAVPMADRVAGELERHYQRARHQADDDLVFAHPLTGAPLDSSQILRRFKRALARAGVRPLRFHDLRHTFGTRMAAAGVPLRTLQEWLGHRDYKTTAIYADYQPGDQESELVERAFTNPVTNLSESAPISENPKPRGSRGSSPA